MPQTRPNLFLIVAIDHHLQGAQGYIIAAAFVSQHMPPTADLDPLAVQPPALATRAGAADNQHPCKPLLWPPVRGGCERRFKIIRRVAR